jgi:hypothetical protein
LADTTDQLDRHRVNSRIFVGSDSFFLEFYRGTENIKFNEWENNLGDGSGCFAPDPLLFVSRELQEKKRIVDSALDMKNSNLIKISRSNPFYYEGCIFYMQRMDSQHASMSLVISFDMESSPTSNSYSSYVPNINLASKGIIIEGNIQFFRLKVERLKCRNYKELMHDYILILYEFNK